MRYLLLALTGILGLLTVCVFGLTVFSAYYSIFATDATDPWADCAGISFTLTVFLGFVTGASAIAWDDSDE